MSEFSPLGARSTCCDFVRVTKLEPTCGPFKNNASQDLRTRHSRAFSEEKQVTSRFLTAPPNWLEREPARAAKTGGYLARPRYVS